MTDSTNENNDWCPSKREYDPGIKEKQWEQLVVDESIFTKNSLITFACIQNATSGTCAGMAKQYGRSANFYNTNVWQTGKRIADKLKIPLVLRESGNEKYWPVCCLARRIGDGRLGAYIGDKIEKYKIKFTGYAKNWIKEHKLADDQSLKETEDCTIITFSSSQFEKILQYVLSWGAQAEPLAPRRLVTRWKKEIWWLYEKIT